MRYTKMYMRRASIYIAAALVFVSVFALAQNPARADGTASIAGLYPAAEVPIGAKVTFSIITSGFTNPTYYLGRLLRRRCHERQCRQLGQFFVDTQQR
jgi:hypothetical protein